MSDDPTSGDRLSAGNIANNQAVALGRGARAEVHYHYEYIERPDPTIPYLVPPLPANHVPRTAELSELKALLLSNQREVAVTALRGMGGVGKTTLAIALCHDKAVLDQFPDGILWTTLGPKAEIASEQLVWGKELGEDLSPISGAPARASRLRTLLYHKRCLIVIDDVWKTEDLALMQVGGPCCATLVTTRERKIAQKVGVARDLDVLSPEQAIALLECWAVQISANELDLARELAKRLGYLPLALALAGAQIQDGQKWQRLLAIFRDAQGADIRKLDLDDASTRDESLALTFNMTVERLEDELRERFAMLGIFAGGREAPFTMEAAAAIWVVSAEPALQSLERLVRVALLERDGDRYSLHLLVRDYACSRLSPAQHDTAEVRHRDFYFEVARWSARDWQAAEAALPQIRHAWEQAARDLSQNLGLWPEVMTVFLSRRGHWDFYEELSRRALEAARLAGRRDREAWCWNWLGIACVRLGKQDDALNYLQQGLFLMHEVGNRAGEAAAMGNIAQVYYERGDLDQALDLLKTSLPILQEVSWLDHWAQALNNIGRIYADRGDLIAALRNYQMSLATLQQIGDREKAAGTINHIGQIEERRGLLDSALVNYEQARAMLHELGDNAGEADTLANIGHILFRRTAFDEALARFQAAQNLYQTVRNRIGEAAMYNDIGAVYYSQGKLPAALDQFQASLAMVRALNNRREQAVKLWNIGVIYAQLGQLRDADPPLEEALSLYEEMGIAQDAEEIRGLLKRVREQD
jgi:tetratricopeptide (TPR) repeat protein